MLFANVAKMRLARSVTIVIIRLCTQNLSATAVPSTTVATCIAGEITPTEARPLDGLSIVCPEDNVLQQVGNQAPNDASNAEVLSNPGGGVTTLSTLLPGGTYVRTMEADSNVDTLTVSQLPANPVVLYFECQHEDRQQSCHIQVTVLPAHRLGPNVCALLGSRLDFSVHAEDETVLFKCGAGFTLFPLDAAKVYDGNCLNELNLDDVLPSSSAKHASTAGFTTLLAVYLPPSPQSFCYICAPPSNQSTADNNCFVRITTAAGGGGPPPSDGGTAAHRATVGTVFLLGIVLAETALQAVR